MPETALVTGACGFIGSHMVEHLLKKGYQVIATDHPSASRERLPQGTEFVPSDVTDTKSLDAFKGRNFSKVFHIAAIFDYVASWERLYRVNCQGTSNLLEFLSKNANGLKSVVVWSSGSVYGHAFEQGRPLPETERPQPINPYERSKLEQEEIALEFHRSRKVPVAVVRPAAVYGPRSRYGLAVPVFLINKGLLRFIPGSGQAIGGFIHVEDVVGAAEFLSTKPEAVGQVFNVSDDSKMTIEQAMLSVADLLGVWFSRVHFPMAPVRAAAWLDQTVSRWLGRRPTLERDLIDYLSRHFWMDNTKLKSLGYRFQYPDLRSGLPETIAWYKQQGWV
jgi:nucleoside-diphosphate-sugar epimerase